MGINVGLAQAQAGKLSRYAATLHDVKNQLNGVKGSLNQGWQAKEMMYINETIDSINREIANLSTKLENIGSDIVATAQQIKREEEAKARAEAEARARAEAEAKAKAEAAAKKED